MIGFISQSADFERVLGTRSQVSSTHFALHHLPDRPSRFQHRTAPVEVELSTAEAPRSTQLVDNVPAEGVPEAPPWGGQLWLGTVVPKRHARRSVTRNLLKRQMRHAVAACETALPAGLWVLRLRAPFDRSVFPSAASEAMKRIARAELERLLADAIASPARHVPAARRRR